MSKPRIAFFDFSCCEGCQLQVLNCEDELLDLLALVDIVQFREAMTEADWNFDIAFVEGSITREQDEPRLKKIREAAKLVIAIGACSGMAGINAIRNAMPIDKAKEIVYGNKKDAFESTFARPIDTVIKVDGYIPGCPIDRKDFLRTVQALLVGKKPPDHDYPVCQECRLRENECLLTVGIPCMGPITRGGCDAIEPTFGSPCIGCRGLVSEANIESGKQMLEKHGLTIEDISKYMTIFNSFQKEEKHA